MNKLLRLASMMLFFLPVVIGSAAAETYPSRPISLIIQFSPGTTTDLVGRRLAELLSKELGVQVVPVNRAGGSGVIGVSEMANSKPDGYTIGMVNMPTLAVIPHLQKVSYDPLAAFHHVGVIGPYEYGVYVSAKSPWKTWEDFIAHAKANPEGITYATPGPGTTNHLIMARIAEDLGIKWVHIPFKGDGEIIPNVLGGHVSAGVGSPAAIVPQVKSGKLRLLLSTSKDRWRDLPDVPTVQEKGFKYFQASFLSLAIPAKTPKPIADRIDAAVRKILTDPATIADFRNQLSTIVAYQDGNTYAAFVRDQNVFYGTFLKTIKLK